MAIFHCYVSSPEGMDLLWLTNQCHDKSRLFLLSPSHFPCFLSPMSRFGFASDAWSGWWFGTWLLFFHILGISSSQLTFIFFQRGRPQPPYTTNQWLFCMFCFPKKHPPFSTCPTRELRLSPRCPDGARTVSLALATTVSVSLGALVLCLTGPMRRNWFVQHPVGFLIYVLSMV